MSIILATYPRSGQHFLREQIKQRLDVKDFYYTHETLKKIDNKIITIARNPIDSICSWVAMEDHYYKNVDIEKVTKIAKIKYKMYYKYLLKNADIVVDYNFLNSNINEIINYLSIFLNIKQTNNIFYNSITNEVDKKHLVSSKETNNYKNIYKTVLQISFTDEDLLYKELLNKSPKLKYNYLNTEPDIIKL